MKYIVIIVVCATLFAILFGAPILSSDGLSWDGSATQARIASHNSLEAARIASAERLEMERLALRDAEGERSAAFWQLFWLLVAVVAVVAVAVYCGYRGLVVVVAYFRHRHDGRMAVMLAALPILAQRPHGYLVEADGQWWVADDAEEELIPVTRRLTG